MNNRLFSKLAKDNLVKNSKLTVPYLITGILTTAMLYMIRSIYITMSYWSATTTILGFGSGVVVIFAVIFMLYTNSFITKNRSKEFGIFSILGLEKRHIAKIVFFENLYTLIISVFCGLVFGIAFDGLMTMAIKKIMNLQTVERFKFSLNVEAIVFALAVMLPIFFIIFLKTILQVRISKPIDLLKGESKGEKEPKSNWLLAVLGLGCLGYGYYLSLTIKTPMSAMGKFFVAVVLVILGTYLTFTAASVVFLKMLKKNKNYYYKATHFISVSGMIYRMKQNAVGLANICILSTMVLVMISSTASLKLGVEDEIKTTFPTDITVEENTHPLDENGNWKRVDTEELKKLKKENNENTNEIIKATADENEIEIKNFSQYSGISAYLAKEGNAFVDAGSQGGTYSDNMNYIGIMTADDFNLIYASEIGEELVLSSGETALYSTDKDWNPSEIEVLGRKFNITKNISDKKLTVSGSMVSIMPIYFIVCNDEDVLYEIYNMQFDFDLGLPLTLSTNYLFDLTGTDAQKIQYAKDIEKLEANTRANEDECNYFTGDKIGGTQNIYELNGSVFFLAIFLGLMFTAAMILVIYYKQVSEGFDDRKRFEIMQNVGLSQTEVKKTIHSQILTVFFLPLITACLHTAAAYPIMSKLLLMLGLTNTDMFIIGTIFSIVIFVVLYFVIYSLTAKVYYKIVKK